MPTYNYHPTIITIIVYIALVISTGILPLVLSRDVSPAGNYSLRIATNTSAQGSVVYTIRDTAEPSGELVSYVVLIELETSNLDILLR